MPDLRHGAGTGNAKPGRRGKPGAARLQPTLLVDLAAHDRGADTGHAWAPHYVPLDRGAHLDRAGAERTGGAVGRLAVLRAVHPVHPQPQSEHVDPDRYRRGLGVRLQRGGDRGPGHLSSLVPRAWPGRGVLRGGGSDRVADPAGSVAGTARAIENLRRHQGLARPGPQDRTADYRGRCRGRHPPGSCSCGRSPTCATGREGAGGRYRAGRSKQHR